MQDRLNVLEVVAAERTEAIDPGHDLLHVRRVAANARRIAEAEGANVEIVVAAALLHELFNYPKDHPESHLSGEVCADRATELMESLGFPAQFTQAVAYCIRYHSFSRGIVPETLEGKVLQDADRLDSIGAVGIARCFSTGSQMGRPFYQAEDPFCRDRQPDDKAWTLDHFYRKLLLIEGTLHTATARQMARARTEFLRSFLVQLQTEI